MQWKITDGIFDGFKFNVAVAQGEKYGTTDVDTKVDRRIQESESALIDGADITDFGRKARSFDVTVVFFGEDYRDQVKKFEDVLNKGTSGVLVLPDADQAYLAKVKSYSKKTSVADGSVLTMSVSWIEDNGTIKASGDLAIKQAELDAARANIQDGNATDAIGTAQSLSAKVNGYADSARSALNENQYLNDARRSLAGGAAFNSGLAGILNVPKQSIAQLVSISDAALGNNDSIKATVSGFLSFLDSFKQKSSTSAAAGADLAPLRFNSGVGFADFEEPDTVTTAVISGNQTVVVVKNEAEKIDSFKTASALLKAQVKDVEANNTEMEALSRGQTSEYRTNIIYMINAMKDLINLIDDKPTQYVFSSIDSSLIEIMFANGVSLDQLERVHILNRGLLDIVDIPAMTVIGI